MNIFTRIMAIAVAVILCACSNGDSNNGSESGSAGGLSGTYSGGGVSYEFTPERVYVKALGTNTATNYAVDGKRVLVGLEGSQQVLTILDDGSLEGAPGMILRKEPEAIQPAEMSSAPDKPKTGSPSDTIDGYLTAMARYDFPAAFEYTSIRHEARERSAEEMAEAKAEMKAGLDAEGGIAGFRVLDEKINGNMATVKVETTMGNGRSATESIRLIKRDGAWLLE